MFPSAGSLHFVLQGFILFLLRQSSNLSVICEIFQSSIALTVLHSHLCINFLLQNQQQTSPCGILLEASFQGSFPFSKTCCQLAFSQFLIRHVLLAFVTNFSCLTIHISYHDIDIFLASRQISSTTVSKRKVIRLVWLILPFANCVILLYKLCKGLYKSHE